MRFLGCRSTKWRSVAAVGLAGGCVAAFAPVAGASAAAPCGSTGTLSSSGATTTCTYTGAGQDAFTVPAGVVSLKVTAVGAAGGAGGYALDAPGSGASVQDAAVPVAASQVLTVVVGGTGGVGTNGVGGVGGSPGGGGAAGGSLQPGSSSYDGGGGGGYSGLLTPVESPLVIAGGGGGSGGEGYAGGSGDTGQGGGAGNGYFPGSGGDGGTSTSGGAGGVGDAAQGGPGMMGAFEQGGQGGPGGLYLGNHNSSGGGGGGGYYGGGGGGGSGAAGGGGGGSSYGITGLTDEALAGGPAAVTISYTVAAAPTVTITTPASGASYTQGQVIDAGYSCSEGTGGPGLSGCSGTVADGSGINTQALGSQAFSVTATSNDGLSTTDTVPYTVAAAAKATTTITPEPQVILPGFSGAGLLHVSATLTSGKTGLAGKTVAFTVKQTKLCSAQTNTSGVATCSINVLQEALVLLTNSYTASFSGDSSDTAATASTPAVSISSLHGLAQTSTRHTATRRHESALQALSAARGRHAERMRARINQILRREHH